MSPQPTPRPSSPPPPPPRPAGPAPNPRPAGPRQRVAHYVVIATCGVVSVAVVSTTPRFDLLVFLMLMTYLIVSLLAPARRHRPQPSARESVGAGVLRGAPAPTP